MSDTGETADDEAATLTMWLGPADQQMYRSLKEGLTVDDSISGEAKSRVKDGLVVRDIVRRRDLSFETDHERQAWIRDALSSAEPPR